MVNLSFGEKMIWSIIDSLIIGVVGALVIDWIGKKLEIKEGILNIILIAFVGFMVFTDKGKEVKAKFSIFNKSGSWNKSAKNSIAIQCAMLMHPSISFKSYTEQQKATVRCCIQNITRNNTQEDYLKNNQSSAFILQDAILECKK
jgi:hypothetical protein